MSLGIVNYGELFTLKVANKCHGYTGEVVAGATTIATYFCPLPDICTFYVLAFLQQLPDCAWSRQYALSGRPPYFWSPKAPPRAPVYFYTIDARLLERSAVNVQAASTSAQYKQMSGRADLDEDLKAQLDAIFARELAEEARQLEAAKVSRDKIFRAMFGGDH